MKIRFTRTALELGWVTEGENVTAKEIKEAVQDDMIHWLRDNMWVGIKEDPVSKFQGTIEYDEEFVTQLNRLAKFFGWRREVVETPYEGEHYDDRYDRYGHERWRDR